ncbi:MAG: DNA cytosine methyltransferase [Thaumarchaeota archaeon]|nr:DNA cytosine methyltransferase [Nitrososphaerota archaeon]
MRRLTVIDLFCGAGGFSEGFRQVGFDVTYAIDNWNPAIEAHKLNQPEAQTMKADIETLDPKLFLDSRPDVLIGGPPCTEFSGSKRGGGGDFQKGMRLVLAFFRFVHVLRPKYWIMENVPRLLQTLPHRVRLQDMGVPEDGFFDVPRQEVFNSANFGAPQKRLRLLSGRYPSPVQTHFEESMLTLDNVLYQPWVPMRKVIGAFPDPLGRMNERETVSDPNYPITIKEKQLEDHFFAPPLYKRPEDGLMTTREAARNKQQKVAHAYYGKMLFPDYLDRPARTVMATQFNASRETMVIETIYRGRTRYRKPTVRECASLQCYPVTYRFPAKTLTTKYKLVGNSVPVILSAAVARAILVEEDIKVPAELILNA